MSLATFHDGLKAALAADTALDNWANSHFGKSLTFVDGNTPIQSLPQDKVPALLLELGDGDNTEEVGNEYQQPETEILGAVVWQEQDRANAFSQRLALPDLLVKAVMADGTLGGKVDGAWVSSWETDKGANHPVQVLRFTVTGQFTIYRP